MFMLTKLSQCLPAGVDACIQGHDCQHVCVPHGDSYLCECHQGFVLNADLKSCARKFGSCWLIVNFTQILSRQSNKIWLKCLSADRQRSWNHLQVSSWLTGFPVVTETKTKIVARYRLPAGLHACAQGHECQHICVDSNHSYTCRCHEGYALNADQQTCSRKSTFSSNDLQVPRLQPWLPVVRVSPPSGSASCGRGHDCQHSCVENGNSHFCTCHEGFALNADLKTCSRKNLPLSAECRPAASNILTCVYCGRVKANHGIYVLKVCLR